MYIYYQITIHILSINAHICLHTHSPTSELLWRILQISSRRFDHTTVIYQPAERDQRGDMSLVTQVLMVGFKRLIITFLATVT